ncbi:uncharacterized protein [Miscanthus floridulus]|uniref:uncharacterized protein n=1 Tax=Miscanthus floridulus TaxID=154761 RepID=UPI0034578EC8
MAASAAAPPPLTSDSSTGASAAAAAATAANAALLRDDATAATLRLEEEATATRAANTERAVQLQKEADLLKSAAAAQEHVRAAADALQAYAVQNIKYLVPIVLDLKSPHYSKWRGYLLLALGRYSLKDHVLSDDSRPTDPVCISTDLLDIIHEHDGVTAQVAWLGVEQQFLGNRESRALLLDVEFRNLSQGDLSIDDYCRKMKGMADALADLGEPLNDRTLVLNVLQGLIERFQFMAQLITRQKPFPPFAYVRTDLCLAELNMVQPYLAPPPGPGLYSPALLPTPHAPPPAWSPWDPHSLAQAFSTVSLTPPTPPNSTDWVFDSGASSHIASNPGIVTHTSSSPFPSSIVVGNGATLPIVGTGYSIIPGPFCLNNVLLAPGIIKNLLSVRQFTTGHHVSIEFDPSGISVKDLRTRNTSSFDVTARGPSTPCSYHRRLLLPALLLPLLHRPSGTTVLVTPARKLFNASLTLL